MEGSAFMSKMKNEDIHHNLNWESKLILVAEDVDTSNMFFAAALRKTKAKVLWAKTGTEAVELARKHPEIDVVLMDIHMPGLNGFEATREIKKINRDISIIIQTAYTLSGEKEKGYEAGADGFITKPIKYLELIKTIKQHI